MGWERAGRVWPAFNLSTQALGGIHEAHLGVVLGCDAEDTLMTKTPSGPNPMEPSRGKRQDVKNQRTHGRDRGILQRELSQESWHAAPATHTYNHRTVEAGVLRG